MNHNTVKGFHGATGVGAAYSGIVLLGGKRTPFGDFTGTLSLVNPIDLGILASRAALASCSLTGHHIDQTIFSSIAQAGPDAYYLARHIGLYSGVPIERPALIVQRICGSGFESIIQAAEQILLNKAEIILAGGTENMSRNPTASYDIRMGYPLGNPGFIDTLYEELLDPACGLTMGQTAENLAEKYHISRLDTDTFALNSQQNYFKAKANGFFDNEIVPVRPCTFDMPPFQARKIKLPKKVEELRYDEHPRETTLDKLAKLPAVFRKDGAQTAGNSSGIVDGAAAVIVASEAAAQKLQIKPLGRILASATVGVSPEIMGIGPAPAIKYLLEITGVALQEIDFFEINEAFGAQCLAVIKEAGIDPQRVNVNGGAIAIGHPLAATGTRMTLTMLRQLTATHSRLGIVTACIGGGQGTALLVEKY